jgi:hypothetical protein
MLCDATLKLKQQNRAIRILSQMEDPADTLMKVIDKFVSL